MSPSLTQIPLRSLCGPNPENKGKAWLLGLDLLLVVVENVSIALHNMSYYFPILLNLVHVE